MLLRPSAVIPIVTALCLALGSAQSTRAAGMASFRLTNLDTGGTPPTREVLALVLPTGSIVPRDVNTDPPTILPASTGFLSSGFDPNALEVSLGEGTLDQPDGSSQPFQALKLDFGPGGFAPGGKLFFQLKWSPTFNPALGDLIRLVLPVEVANLAIETITLPADSPTPPTGGNPVPPVGQVPEPQSVAIWTTVLLGLGIGRGLLHRRRVHAARPVA